MWILFQEDRLIGKRGTFCARGESVDLNTRWLLVSTDLDMEDFELLWKWAPFGTLVILKWRESGAARCT